MNPVVGMQARRRNRGPVVRRWVMAAAVTVLVVEGCDANPGPAETPEPQVTYGQVASNLCERMQMEQVATRFGMKLQSSYDRTVQYDPRGGNGYLSCAIRTRDDGDRFRTPFGEFDPAGTVRLRTYSNHEEAEEDHKAEISSIQSFVKSKPEVSTQAVSGWWDEGLYVQTIAPLDPKQYPRLENLDAAGVEVLYELRHGNLRITTRLDNRAITPKIEEVLAFLRDFAQAYTDEAVSHLTRTGPD